jgi:hypothetical protein
MTTNKGKRKCQCGTKNIRVPIELHRFISKAGQKLGLNNYELIDRMAQHFAPLFCPELAKLISKQKD